ncbi:putative membrane protein [Paenibacillus castaneae]|uniref:SdpI family protein n=1 Tax=Paenibacillus castaneae TaxID=474957 RepID=UPI000C9CC77F|nr:SdpI family protein [Paenibacillus castaneae]NIK76601.1 putative membrane protein [Paenibacillus castaneae]
MSTNIISWLFIAIAVAATIVTYSDMPEQMSIQWDLNSEVKEYANKAFAVYLLPGVMTLLTVLLPRNQNYQKFKSSLLILQNVLLLGLLSLHGVILASGYGLEVDLSKIVLPMVGIIFVTVGIYMPKFPPNNYFGIKTVYTVNNETVWRLTHRASAKYFILGGLLMIGTAFIPAPYQMILFLTIVVIVVLTSVYLSYHFAKHEKQA